MFYPPLRLVFPDEKRALQDSTGSMIRMDFRLALVIRNRSGDFNGIIRRKINGIYTIEKHVLQDL